MTWSRNSVRPLQAVMAAYLCLTVVEALRPTQGSPARSYDMFAHRVAPQRWRTIMIFHTRAGRSIAVAPIHLLPFEAARNTSIVRSAMSSGESRLSELGRAVVQAHRRGWRRFDQVWGPANLPVDDISAVCAHVVPASELDRLVSGQHEECRIEWGPECTQDQN